MLSKIQNQPQQKVTDSNYRLTVIAEHHSPINGTLLVTTNSLLGTNIITPGKVAQSGDVITKTWESVLIKIKIKNNIFSNVLIFGFGGGSTANLVYRLWPKSEITGVEIDPLIISLGNKYFNYPNKRTNIVISDAFKFLSNKKEFLNKKFDLVLVDLFIDSKTPKIFLSDKFIKPLSLQLSKNGIVIFNQLNLPQNKKDILRLKYILSGTFKKIYFVTYQKNLLIMCFNN
ncbi:MAG: hypothetical protein A2Z35_03700 [Actinobacteria bacterium RBG_19FT_COMBO_36_27]|nr:MAG: hypothetical protein A2Z35_03700 [Actinobacteria bacterium RBG_19FT_COMBO_36_27]